MEFAARLKALREEAGMTQAALAKKAKLSARTIQSWEQGQRVPVSEAFFMLTKALGVSADAFAGTVRGTQPPKRKGKRK